MDEQPPKAAKITIRIDYADGSAIEVQAAEPHDVGVDVTYPEPVYDFTQSNPLVSYQPPPTIIVRFIPDKSRGFTERHITRAENEHQES